MSKKADMQTIARQFPWLWEQEDGTFDNVVIRASLNLYGTGLKFGWWTQAPCCNNATSYAWGSELLRSKFLTEKEGWKLPNNQIPWLDFTDGRSAPENMPGRLSSWMDYYSWRGLPMESPACLLLQWPMSMYRLLDLLQMIPEQPLKERRTLIVHYIGVERELDFLPV